MIKSRPLHEGARIAVVSPSNGLPHLFPHQYEKGLEMLEKHFGFEIVEMPTARMAPGELYTHPELRAKDLNDAFLDPRIDGIICSIGGYESVRILPHLDTEAILTHPKFFMGFSDSTTFLSYLNTLGMVTFYGPSVMAGLAQLDHSPRAVEHLKAIMLGEDIPYVYRPYDRWAHAYVDWRDKDRAGEIEEWFTNETGFTWLQGTKPVQGPLWGGCMEVLENLKGTRFWPQEDFWDGKVLFFETSETKPSPVEVGCWLRNYGMQGILDKVAGILFGRPKDYTAEEAAAVNRIIRDVLAVEFGLPDLPVVAALDFGHTDPKWVLPMGCAVRIDPEKQEITLVESPYIAQL